SLLLRLCLSHLTVFLFHQPTPAAIYTLSLHDALPICLELGPPVRVQRRPQRVGRVALVVLHHARPAEVDRELGDNSRPSAPPARDRKSTRLNSSHVKISYAVFCLKKKK